MGPLNIKKFMTYLEVAKDFMQQDDIEFAHIDINKYDEKQL